MLEKHHIIFKSSGGLDFDLNYKYLTANNHRGNNGPHMNRETNLRYKRELEEKLRQLFTRESYLLSEVIELLGLDIKQAQKAFKRLESVDGIEREDIIYKLLGDRYYL